MNNESTTIETRRSLWRLRRWRWYWRREDGKTLAFSARSYRYEQLAWEDAQHYFGAGVTMVYKHGRPDESFEVYAGPRDWSD